MDDLPQKIEDLSKRVDDLSQQVVGLFQKIGDSSQQENPRSGLGWNVNQYLNQYIGLADTKVSALVAADLAIIILLLPNKPTTSLFFFLLLYWLALFLFVCSTLAGIITFYPRVKKETVKKGEGFELIFWRGILSSNGYEGLEGYNGYQQALKDKLIDVQKVEDEYARENYHLSEVLQRKNIGIRLSIIFFGGGLLCALASTGLSFIIR